MTPEEIKKGAPDGATHYALYEGIAVSYFKFTNNIMYIFCNIFNEWKVDDVEKTSNFKNRLKPLP